MPNIIDQIADSLREARGRLAERMDEAITRLDDRYETEAERRTARALREYQRTMVRLRQQRIGVTLALAAALLAIVLLAI